MLEKIPLETIYKGMQNQKALSSQPGFLSKKLETVYKTNPNCWTLDDLQKGTVQIQASLESI